MKFEVLGYSIGYCRRRGLRMRFQGRGPDGSFERLFLASPWIRFYRTFEKAKNEI